MRKVLYIDVDGARNDGLAEALDRSEFTVFSLRDPAGAGDAISRVQPDVVLLACSRPDVKVQTFCSGLRQLSGVPIVVCSASSRESDVVGLFQAGADDCLVTPIRAVELNARLRAVLRRASEMPAGQPREDVLVAGDVEIRLKEHKAFRRGQLIDLSPMEFRLLMVLVQHAGRAVSHSRLIAGVWGPEYVDCRNYLRLYVKYLRSKIEDDPSDPRLIVNEWGVGYRFEPAALS